MATVNIDVGANQEKEQPVGDEHTQDSLRSVSVCVKCPTCSYEGATRVTPSWNIITCLCGYFCTPFYCCYSMYKRKDWNCYNAEHRCASDKGCNALIGEYSSC